MFPSVKKFCEMSLAHFCCIKYARVYLQEQQASRDNSVHTCPIKPSIHISVVHSDR